MSEADDAPMEKPGEEWFGGKHKMTEKKGPFDAGGIGTESAELILRVLKKRLDKPDEDGIISHTFHLGQNDKPGIEAGICVLEVAGHTDTMACLKFLERVNEDGEMRDEQGLLLFPLAQIRSLLRKSLPDKEGEKR
jgi:hypothetical protein